MGVDLSAASALVSCALLDGRTIEAQRHDIASRQGAARLTEVAGLITAVKKAWSHLGPLHAVTISTTGTIDGTGTVMQSIHVPDWTGFPLGTALSETLRVPVRVENDVNCSAFGEFIVRFDAGQLPANGDLVFIHVEGGLVTGLVLGGQLHRGTSFNAGEVGIRFGSVGSEEDGKLERITHSIGAVAAVLDPSVIVIFTPADGPDATAEIVAHLGKHLEDTAPLRLFENARLGAAAAGVGALALSLADGRTRVTPQAATRPWVPRGLTRIENALKDGHHTA